MAITAHPSRMPRSLSSTALAMYQRCPREFALSYLTDEDDPRLPTPQLVLGNAVHAALASYLRAPERDRSETAAHQLLRHHWSQAPRTAAFIHAEEEAAWGRRALALISRVCAGLDGAAHPFAIEEWVRARLPNGRRVCGRIDRADRLEGGLEIIDYKTGRRPRDFAIADEVAPRVYALAGFRTFHQPVLAVRFRWLTQDIDDVWSPQDMAEIEDELAELTERVCTDRAMAAQPGVWCGRCPYRDRCPAVATPTASPLAVADDLPF